MKLLGDLVELCRALDDPPLRVDPDIAHERHDGREHLGDAATERGRVHVEDARTAKPCGERSDLLYLLIRRDSAICL